MRNIVVLLILISLIALLGCGSGQVKKEPSTTASIQKQTDAPAGMDQKGWKFKYRRGTFVFTDGTGSIRGGFLSAAGLAALDNKILVEKFGEVYFSRINSNKSYFYQYSLSRSPTLINMKSDNSGNLIIEPLTKEQQNIIPINLKDYAINQIYFDGDVGDFIARQKDKIILTPNEIFKVKAYNKLWECKYIGTSLGEITVGETGFTYGPEVSCK